HDLPDAFPRVPGYHVIRNHLVFDDVRLELHALTAGGVGVIDHLKRLLKAAFVIDADFGDDQRRVLGADEPAANGEFVLHNGRLGTERVFNRASAIVKSKRLSISTDDSASMTYGRVRAPQMER